MAFKKGTETHVGSAERRKGGAKPVLSRTGGSFLISFLVGFLIVLLALTAALAVNALDEERFANALLTHVDYPALGTDEASVRSFAGETIRYLSGAQKDWDPQITVQGISAGAFIPQAFRAHMASVRNGVVSGRLLATAGVVLTLVLLGCMLLGGRRRGRLAYSPAGYFLGALFPLALIGGLGAWAYLNFDGMWAWLHETFIRDGIFNAAEPVMRLFPVELFAEYLPPVARSFGLGLTAVPILFLLSYPLARRLAGRPGGNAPSRRS